MAGLACRGCALGVLRAVVGAAVLSPSLDLLRIGLTLGLWCVWARGRVVLFATDFFTVVATGVFSGVIEGVTFLAARLPYGSAVAGLASSGRRIGRLAVPLINEPVPFGFAPNADFVAEFPSADGGRARPDDAVEAFDVVLEPRDFADADFTGDE